MRTLLASLSQSTDTFCVFHIFNLDQKHNNPMDLVDITVIKTERNKESRRPRVAIENSFQDH